MFCFYFFRTCTDFLLQTLWFLLAGEQEYFLPLDVGYPSYATAYRATTVDLYR